MWIVYDGTPACLCHRYFLQPRDNDSKSVKPEELGSLRLNITYTEDHVLTSEAYGSLRELLLKSACLQVCVSAGVQVGRRFFQTGCPALACIVQVVAEALGRWLIRTYGLVVAVAG